MTSILALWRKAPVDLAIGMLMFMLILGSDYALGESAPFMKDILYMYLFMFIIGRIAMPNTEKKEFPLGKALFMSAVMFFGTAVIMSLMPQMILGQLAAAEFDARIAFAVTFGVAYCFIKAYIEEDIFRNRLSVALGQKSEVMQSVIFGLFHFFVLVTLFGFTVMLIAPIALLMVLGYVWGRLQDKVGTLGVTGSHFAYNAAILGLLPKILGSVV